MKKTTLRMQKLSRHLFYEIIVCVLLAAVAVGAGTWDESMEGGPQIAFIALAGVLAVFFAAAIVFESVTTRAFLRYAADPACPAALLSEKNIELYFEAAPEALRGYAQFLARAEQDARAAELAGRGEKRKRLRAALKEGKRRRKALGKVRAVEDFTPEDLLLFRGKTIYAPEELYRKFSFAPQWEAAEKENAVLLFSAQGLTAAPPRAEGGAGESAAPGADETAAQNSRRPAAQEADKAEAAAQDGGESAAPDGGQNGTEN